MNATDTDLLTDLLARERLVWQALVDGDAARDAALLDDDFLGVYPDGFATKADHLGQLEDGPTILTFDLSEAQARSLGPGHALLSYRATFQRRSREEPEVMYVTSIWHRRGAGWVNVFSQDTPAVELRP